MVKVFMNELQAACDNHFGDELRHAVGDLIEQYKLYVPVAVLYNAARDYGVR